METIQIIIASFLRSIADRLHKPEKTYRDMFEKEYDNALMKVALNLKI